MNTLVGMSNSEKTACHDLAVERTSNFKVVFKQNCSETEKVVTRGFELQCTFYS